MREVGGYVRVDFLLSGGPRGPNHMRLTLSLWLGRFQYDHLFLLRIAMMAQAVFACDLLLGCRAKVIMDPLSLLLDRVRRGPYSCLQACP